MESSVVSEQAVSESAGLVSVSFELPEQEAAILRELAHERGESVTQVLRQAIVEKRFFRNKISEGKKVLLQETDGNLIQVTWTP